MRAAGLFIAVLALSLAGCTAVPEDKAVEAPQEASRDGATMGSLLVTVVTPDLYSIDGATVTVSGQEMVTDGNGNALFKELAQGLAVIEAQKQGYRPASAGAEIRAGEQATARIKLLPGESTPVAPPAPTNSTGGSPPIPIPQNFTEQFTLNGYFDCSATYLIITGDCLLIVDAAAEELGRPERPGNATKEEYVLEFPLDLRWQYAEVEMQWNASSPLGEQMTLAVEPAEAPADGHAAKYARTAGVSPLRIRLDAGTAHANATASADGEAPDMPNALGGEVLRTRSYVQGLAHNPGGTTFLGAGAALQQRFQVLVTVHYGPLPTGAGT